MTASEYFAAPGLSFSSMKDLAISPLRFWARHIDPNRKPEEPSTEMIFGTALHAAVLEPAQFDARYACKLDVTDFPGALVTMDDLRAWLKSKDVVPKGTRKSELIALVQHVSADYEVDEQPIIWDERMEIHSAEHKCKTLFSKEDWCRIGGATQALREEPEIQRILADGCAEVPLFSTDPDTGVPLKCRLDWMAPTCTLDVKTFSVKRSGKSIDETVADAIYYERYHWQAYLYSYMRMLATGGARTPIVIAFVESEQPYEVRIKKLSPGPSLYWSSARMAVRNLIIQYAQCVERFGDQHWRYRQSIEELQDEEMRALTYA
jgi:hypothetical protein